MEIVEMIIKWAVPFALGGTVTGCITYIKMLKKKQTALENGVQCLLRAEIIREHKEYSAKGSIPIYAKEALVRAYNSYHALGGNDVATGLYNDIMALPVSGESVE